MDFRQRNEEFIICAIFDEHIFPLVPTEILFDDFPKYSDTMVTMYDIIVRTNLKKKIQILRDAFFRTIAYKNITKYIICYKICVAYGETLKASDIHLFYSSREEIVILKKIRNNLGMFGIEKDILARVFDKKFQLL